MHPKSPIVRLSAVVFMCISTVPSEAQPYNGSCDGTSALWAYIVLAGSREGEASPGHASMTPQMEGPENADAGMQITSGASRNANTYDQVKLIFDLVETPIILLTLAVTVFFSWRTSRDTKRAMTTDALDSFAQRICQLYDEVKQIFDEEEYQETIKYAVIREKMRDPQAARKLKNLLNEYERLARGVHLGVYDEVVVRLARRANLIATYKRYKELISARRKAGSRSWEFLEKLAERWISGQNYYEGTAAPVVAEQDGKSNA
jgi:hypothetical protein